MLKSKKLIFGSFSIFLGIIFFCGLIFTIQAENGDDAKATADITKSEVYWIGIQAVPVPEIFLSHFGATEESGGLMIVERVVPDAPADKAGVKRGDIFLKFGDKEIHSLPNLIEQVTKVKETATELEIIRNGEKTTITVTPVPRPDISEIPSLQEMPQIPPFRQRMPFNVLPDGNDPQLMLRQMEELFKQLQEGNDADGQFMPPNIPQNFQQPGLNSGKQLSVVTQTLNGKTTIKVTQVLKDGDNAEMRTWEVESLDELPDEIREEVQSLFGQ